MDEYEPGQKIEIRIGTDSGPKWVSVILIDKRTPTTWRFCFIHAVNTRPAGTGGFVGLGGMRHRNALIQLAEAAE